MRCTPYALTAAVLGLLVAADIPAPAATVWQVLIDTDRYADWNPFMLEHLGFDRDQTS